jgi:hypothetical protein
MKISALRLLPPLAFARFGSASKPQDNYELKIKEDNPLGFRQIHSAKTLIVATDGTITIQPAADRSKLKLADINKMFRDAKDIRRIRPVAPFFELFAIIEEKPDELVPVTLKWLSECGLDYSNVEWKVHVENRKVFRRTGDKDDIVKAKIDWFGGHEPKTLCSGTCVNFIEGIELGQVQYVEPNDTCETSSHIRLRFTPAKGRIYGPVERNPQDEALGVKAIYKGGAWPSFDDQMPEKKKRETDGDETWPRHTLPPSLYANTNEPPAAPWLNHDRAVSRGYLDDACDGFIHARLKKDGVPLNGEDGKPLEAKARICVAPPAFIPDSQFVRTLDDDLDQVVNGPRADDLNVKQARERALDIVRRAYETVRFMNVAVMNGNPVKGRPAEAFDTMPAEEAFATERPVRPVMAPAIAETAAVLALHQQVFATLSSGTAPWFSQLLRRPNEVGDLTDQGRRKMPALMSGADSFYLALTHRQIATIEMAAKSAEPADEPAEAEQPAENAAEDAQPVLSPVNLTAQLRYKARGNPVTSRPEMAVANCCPGLEVDFRAVWRRLFAEIELSEWENYVVKGAVDIDGKRVDLKGHRLLRVNGNAVTVTLQGPSPSDLIATRKETSPSESEGKPADDKPDADGKPIIRSNRNPHGVWTMEWSNCLAHVIDALRERRKREDKPEFKVECEFTKEAAEQPQSYLPQTECLKVNLTVRDFFEPDTAVISKELVEAGELTQGLCSPWQNDLRECSCFYWASSRPDFVNTKVGPDGLTHGDYWFARKRTGEYVPDDYADTRLISYDELFAYDEHEQFANWELLQLQIGGKDSAPNLKFPPPRRPKT